MTALRRITACWLLGVLASVSVATAQEHPRTGYAFPAGGRQGTTFQGKIGGQYLDGTTDITRTIAIGPPTAEMKERATLVLKGHIAIATARFPQGTRGIDLDPFARRALWQHGLDYDHGTGHGVGLCVMGAARMARAGGSFDSILATYFPGTTLGAISTPDPRVEVTVPAGAEREREMAVDLVRQTLRAYSSRLLVEPPSAVTLVFLVLAMVRENFLSEWRKHQRAYRAMALIHFDGIHYRRDIAWQARSYFVIPVTVVAR